MNLVHSLRGAALAALLLSPAARAQQDPVLLDLKQKLESMQRQLAEQRSLIDALARRLAAREAALAGGRRCQTPHCPSGAAPATLPQRRCRWPPPRRR